MALRDFRPERVALDHKGEALLTVRGLNLDDLALLVNAHLADLRRLSELWDGAQDEIFATVMQDGFILRLVAEVPSLAGTILALAADEPDEVEVIRTLPLGYQTLAMAEVVRMTLEDVGGPKEFAALIGGMMAKKPTPTGAATTTAIPS